MINVKQSIEYLRKLKQMDLRKDADNYLQVITCCLFRDDVKFIDQMKENRSGFVRSALAYFIPLYNEDKESYLDIYFSLPKGSSGSKSFVVRKDIVHWIEREYGFKSEFIRMAVYFYVKHYKELNKIINP